MQPALQATTPGQENADRQEGVERDQGKEEVRGKWASADIKADRRRLQKPAPAPTDSPITASVVQMKRGRLAGSRRWRVCSRADVKYAGGGGTGRMVCKDVNRSGDKTQRTQ